MAECQDFEDMLSGKRFVAEIRKQISQYKRFKRLVQQWVELAMEHSKVQMGKGKKAHKSRIREDIIK